MGIFTGDFVFVGSIGRPDLLETAAGIAGSAEAGARQLFRSVQRFRELPDHLQIWPAHGAGSACGKGLGAIPSSTVGYEKRFNPALQFHDEQAFVDYVLSGQPETPFYFAVMKRVNKVGPALLRTLPAVRPLPPDEAVRLAQRQLVIDTSASAEFSQGHVPGTINVPSRQLVAWAGFFVGDGEPVAILTSRERLEDDLRNLRSIGIDNVAAVLDADEVRRAGLRTESYRSLPPEELRTPIERGEVRLLDVRAATEFQEGHIPGAEHFFLGRLLRDLERLDRSRPVVTQCLAGGRSAIAASILQRAGFDVTNLQGGFAAWVAAGLPVATN
jgi:hydroxyacylglutathione hydrolase